MCYIGSKNGTSLIKKAKLYPILLISLRKNHCFEKRNIQRLSPFTSWFLIVALRMISLVALFTCGSDVLLGNIFKHVGV